MTSASETTPLNPIIKEQLKKKATSILEKSKSIVKNLFDAGTSIRSFAIIVTAALIIDSGFGFLSHLLSFNLKDAIIDIYVLFIGLATFVMESDKAAIPYSEVVRRFLTNQASFVQNVIGRGSLYIAVGTLELCQSDIVSYILGLVMVLVGAAYVVLGRSAQLKVHQIRSQEMSDGELQQKFNSADTNGGGEIDCNEFYVLLNDMGANVNVKEAEMLFIPLDHDFDQGLTFDEFKAFWRKP